MTKALRDKVTAAEIAVLKNHVNQIEEFIAEDDINAAQDYLDTITADAKRIALLLLEAGAGS